MQFQLDKNYIKFRKNEPKASTGIARTFFGIIPVGIYAGFHLRPGLNPREIVVYSDPKLNFDITELEDLHHTKGWSIAVWNSKNGYNVTNSLPKGCPSSEITLSYDSAYDDMNLYVVLRNDFTEEHSRAYLEIVTEADLDEKIPEENFDVIVAGGFHSPATEIKLEQSDIKYFSMKYLRMVPYGDENKLGFISPEQIRRINSIEDSALVYAFDGEMTFDEPSNTVEWTEDIDLIFATRNNAKITAGNIVLNDNELAYVNIDKGAITDLAIKTQSLAGYKYDSGSMQKIAPEDVFLPIDIEEFQPLADLETNIGLTEVVITGGGSALKDAVNAALDNTRIVVNDSLVYDGEIDIENFNTLAIVVASGETPIINGGGLERYGFKIFGETSNILIKGFKITNMVPNPSDYYFASGVVLGNGLGATTDLINGVMLDSLDIYNTGRHCISACKTSSGLNAGEYFLQNMLVKDCVCRDISYPTVTPSNIWECGILLRKTQGVVVYNTTIKDIKGHLLISEDNNNLITRGCLFKNALSGESTGINGIVFKSEEHVSWPSHIIELINTVVKSAANGIDINSTQGAIDLSINHVVTTEHTNGLNLVNDNPLKIRNTIIHGCSTMGVQLNGISADLDYNNFWSNVSDISDNSELGQHTKAVDPEFVNPSIDDYNISSSSALKGAGSDDFDIGLYIVTTVDYETGTTAFKKIIFFRKGTTIYSEIVPEGRLLTWRKNQVGDVNDTLIERTQKLSEFSRELTQDRNLVMESGDVVFSITGGLGDFHVMDEIKWTDDELNIHTIPAGIHAEDLADNEFVYVEMPRSATPAILTLKKNVGGIPEQEGKRNYFLLGFRRGNNFILSNGVVLNDGITGRWIGNPLPEFTWIHGNGVQDGVNKKKFVFTGIEPASKSSILIHVGPTKMNYIEHYSVTITGTGFIVEFTENVDEYTDVKAFYPTLVFRAADAVIITGDGLVETESKVIDATMITNKGFDLAILPNDDSKVLAWIVGEELSGNLVNGTHFNVSGTSFSWNGTSIDGKVKENDVINLIYFVD